MGLRWERGLGEVLVLAVVVLLGVLAGCAPDARHEATVALLRTHFPQHADRVLGASGPRGLAAMPDGTFAPTPRAEPDPVRAAEAALAARGGLHATFPARGDGAVRMTLPDGLAIEVREVGLHAAARLARGAVVYEHGSAGASFWSVADGGYEEWLLVRAPGPAPVARWEVKGATLRQRGEAIEIVDRAGTTRLTVTAPAAYTETGAPVRARLSAVGAQLALTIDGAPGVGLALVDPAWQVTGSMATARAEHTATLLPSGKVLVVGGLGPSVGHLASAEVYDPAAGTFAPTTGPLATTRRNHTATLLPSGEVLVVGGQKASGYLASAEVYDPAAGTFAPTTGSLATARSDHTATLLASGQVLLVGGESGGSGYVALAELYDPAARSFTPTTGPLVTARRRHTATLLSSGKVLVAGGVTGLATFPPAAELYDPGARTFAPTTGPLATGRAGHTATLLPSGKVLVAGGYYWDGADHYLASAELYDATANAFSSMTASLLTARAGQTATLLPSGKILLAGGCNTGTTGNCTTSLDSAELFDPGGDGTFAAANVLLTTARFGHAATLLPSGKVFLVGGRNGSSYAASAELYDPGTGGAIGPSGGGLASARAGHTATLLPSGKVLLAGGAGAAYSTVATAELYDPSSGSSVPTAGPLETARAKHTATLLLSGKVLLVGGFSGNISDNDPLAWKKRV